MPTQQINPGNTLPKNSATVNTLYHQASLPCLSVSSFTEHAQCDAPLTDPATANCHLQLTQQDIGLDGRPKCSKF